MENHCLPRHHMKMYITNPEFVNVSSVIEDGTQEESTSVVLKVEVDENYDIKPLDLASVKLEPVEKEIVTEPKRKSLAEYVKVEGEAWKESGYDTVHEGYVGTEKIKVEDNDYDQTYTCYRCSETFTQKSNFDCHSGACLQKVEPQEEQSEISGTESQHSTVKQFACNQCPYTSNRRCYLKKHINVKHAHIKPFKCDQCPFSTANRFNLNVHVETKHTDIRRYACSYCDYCTANSTNLKTHIEVKHFNIKPYQCGQCKYSSAHKANLKRHVDVKHSDDKPFACDQCNYSTAISRNLKLHLRRHTKVKVFKVTPFTCSECDFATGYLASLKRHAKQHTVKLEH